MVMGTVPGKTCVESFVKSANQHIGWKLTGKCFSYMFMNSSESEGRSVGVKKKKFYNMRRPKALSVT